MARRVRYGDKPSAPAELPLFNLDLMGAHIAAHSLGLQVARKPAVPAVPVGMRAVGVPFFVPAPVPAIIRVPVRAPDGTAIMHIEICDGYALPTHVCGIPVVPIYNVGGGLAGFQVL